MKTYAQKDASGRVVALVQSAGAIIADNVEEVATYDADILGKVSDGAGGWIAPAKTEAEQALEALAEIDRASGMPRLLRETLLSIAGASAPAKLTQYEAQAAAHRAKLAP